MALTDKLSAIGNAIREKTGKSDLLTLEQMPQEIAGIQTGVGDGQFATLVDGTMTDFVATNQMQGIRQSAFGNYSGLRSADLTNLGTKNGSLNGLIGPDAFSKCTNLDRITLPKAAAAATSSTQWILSRAFQETNLSEFVTNYFGTFGWNAVQIFRSSPALREVRIPNINFGGSFEYFDACPALELVEFGGGNVGTNVFRGCTSLRTIIIRSDTVSTLANVNAFTSVAGPVNIHVNEALIEDYRAATNWSSLYANGTVNFVAIEGGEYE